MLAWILVVLSIISLSVVYLNDDISPLNSIPLLEAPIITFFTTDSQSQKRFYVFLLQDARISVKFVEILNARLMGRIERNLNRFKMLDPEVFITSLKWKRSLFLCLKPFICVIAARFNITKLALSKLSCVIEQ